MKVNGFCLKICDIPLTCKGNRNLTFEVPFNIKILPLLRSILPFDSLHGILLTASFWLRNQGRNMITLLRFFRGRDPSLNTILWRLIQLVWLETCRTYRKCGGSDLIHFCCLKFSTTGVKTVLFIYTFLEIWITRKSAPLRGASF